MKIALLQDDFPPHHAGGAGVIAHDLAHAYAARGNDVLIITTVQKKEHAGERIENGLRVMRIYAHYPERWRAWLSLHNPQTVSAVAHALRAFKPDVTHVHNVHHHLSYAAIAHARKHSKRVFLTAHDALLVHYGKIAGCAERLLQDSSARPDNRISQRELLRTYRFRYNPFRTIGIRRALRGIDGIVPVSHSLAEALEDNGVRIRTVIHNGIDVPLWDALSAAAPPLPLPEGKRYLLFAGRVSRQKGGDASIEALMRVLERIPHAALLVVGEEDDYVRGLRTKLAAKGHKDAIACTGWLSRESMPAAYARAEACLVPSLYMDPFPTINLEAMASRKPVIATCCGGSSEIVQDGTTGYIVNPLDTEAYAVKMLELLENPERARTFAEAGRARIAESFTLGQQADAYLKLFTAEA
ncbi:MAG: hypothetical protein JWL88_407 [Parcubacteria group bacterium]|nr:hypothetical protein [Parcubacteria group bacterium]